MEQRAASDGPPAHSPTCAAPLVHCTRPGTTNVVSVSGEPSGTITSSDTARSASPSYTSARTG
jgi:hypothetical protein